MNADIEIGLVEFVRAVREQLIESAQDGAESALRFEVGPVELELEVRTSRDYSVDGGIRVWVVSAGGKATDQSSTSHRLKITLDPKMSGAESVLLGSQTGSRPE